MMLCANAKRTRKHNPEPVVTARRRVIASFTGPVALVARMARGQCSLQLMTVLLFQAVQGHHSHSNSPQKGGASTIMAVALQQRWQSIQERLNAAEAAAELFCRFSALAARLDAAEHALQYQADQQPQASTSAAAEAAAAASRQAAYEAATGPDASPIQLRLAQELRDKGFSDFRFVRVPGDYYDQPLEFRRACLKAASIDHLCKSIIMENTKAHPSVQGWDDPNNSKYYVVILQYTARLNADKLKNYIHRLSHGRFGKQYYNMRLCPEDISDSLSGYEHNAVSPIGIKTPLPIILSHEITKLHPDFFFLGAGEVDLKVGFSAAEFVDTYQPMVVDCTY